MKELALLGVAHALIALGLLLAGLSIVRALEPPPLAPLEIDAIAADWSVCRIDRGAPLPLQKAYHRNPNGEIA